MPLVEIRILKGRSPERKKRLLDAVTRAVEESLEAPLRSIRVWIQEIEPDEYMVEGELASERRARPEDPDGS